MPGPPVTPCSRCSHPLRPEFRFCPECALPLGGEGVLSTQIQEVRLRAGERRTRDWTRLMLPSATFGMLAFVAAIGWIVFVPGTVDEVLPAEIPAAESVRVRLPPAPVVWEPEWVTVPGDNVWLGQNVDVMVSTAGFQISKYEISNSKWLEFLEEQRDMLVAREMWQEAFPGFPSDRCEEWDTGEKGEPLLDPDARDLPVRNISAGAALLFCNWLTRKIDIRGVRIRLPHEGEWEYAARGNTDQRFPWGREFFPVPPSSAKDRVRKPVIGLNTTRPIVVSALLDDRSPFGVIGMGSNVSEWVLQAALEPISEEDKRLTWVLPSLDNDFIPRRVGQRGGSFRDEVIDPAPFRLTNEELREFSRDRYDLYRKSPAIYEPADIRDLRDDLERVSARVRAAELELGECRERLQQLLVEPDPDGRREGDREQAKLALDAAGWRHAKLLFVRARLRDRLQEWSDAASDYGAFQVKAASLPPDRSLDSQNLEVPEDEDRPPPPSALVVAEERAGKVRRNAQTVLRASAWYERDSDASLKYDTTGFRIVRVTRAP